MAVAAVFLRGYGLDHRIPYHDETHYRGDMSQVLGELLVHRFRSHSVRHEWSRAPHGLAPELFCFVVAKMAENVLTPLLPGHDYRRNNILSRLGNALFSLGVVALMFMLGREWFGYRVALALAFIATLSPLLINWGRSEYTDVSLTFFALAGIHFTWQGLRQLDRRLPWQAALLAGGFMALALNSKWSLLVFLPFVPLAYLLSRLAPISQGSSHWDRKDFGFLGLWLIGFSLICFSTISLDSWKWALAPPPGPYGDPRTAVGPLKMLQVGLIHSFSGWTRFNGAAVYWGGPVFFLLWLCSLYPLAKAVLRRDERAAFVACLLAGAMLYTLMSLAGWHNWRAYLVVCAAIVSTGFLLETLPKHQFRIVIAIVGLSALPLSFYCGWRLGPQPVEYWGADLTYFDVLPQRPEYDIFPLRHHMFEGIRHKLSRLL